MISIIVIEKKEECSLEHHSSNSINHVLPDPMSSKSRRIMKRERAKQRNQAKKSMEEAILSGEIPQKFIPEEFHQPNLDEKTKKKMIQAIKNRIAAQQSRDRKKQLIEQLENHQRQLADENLKLKGKVRQLEQENLGLQQKTQEYERLLENIYSLTDDQEQLFSRETSVNSAETKDPDPKEKDKKPSQNNRKPSRLGGFMGYTFALATIFAVLLYNNINSSITKTSTMVSNISQQAIFQSPISKGIITRITFLF